MKQVISQKNLLLN